MIKNIQKVDEIPIGTANKRLNRRPLYLNNSVKPSKAAKGRRVGWPWAVGRGIRAVWCFERPPRSACGTRPSPQQVLAIHVFSSRRDDDVDGHDPRRRRRRHYHHRRRRPYRVTCARDHHRDTASFGRRLRYRCFHYHSTTTTAVRCLWHVPALRHLFSRAHTYSRRHVRPHAYKHTYKYTHVLHTCARANRVEEVEPRREGEKSEILRWAAASGNDGVRVGLTCARHCGGRKRGRWGRGFDDESTSTWESCDAKKRFGRQSGSSAAYNAASYRAYRVRTSCGRLLFQRPFGDLYINTCVNI